MAFNEQPCPIWDEPPFPGGIPHRTGLYNSARAGGSFVLEQTGTIWLQLLSERGQLTDRQRANLSYWIYDHNLQNRQFDYSTLREESLLVLNDTWAGGHWNRTPSAADRLLMFLRELIRSDDVGNEPNEALLMAAGGCRHDRDLKELLRYALERGWLEGGGEPGTPSFPHLGLIEFGLGGRIYVEQWARELNQRGQGFVAMSFDPSLTYVYEDGIKPAIEDAGYKPMLIKDKDYTGGVMDEIMAEIRQSRFVVADFTACEGCTADEPCEKNAPGGVYCEAGFALGLDIPVFLTCRKGCAQTIHFDIDHLNRIEWETPKDLRESLKNRIEAVLTRDPQQ